MPAWRCPHCGAPQPETARCWVCQRSTTCCATCRHYRRGVASDLGYCGLDRQRRPLHGDEMRACWAGSIKPLLAETRPIAVMSVPPERPALAFVPVDSLVTAGHLVESAGSGTPDDPPVSDPVERPMSLGWTLWGDAYL